MEKNGTNTIVYEGKKHKIFTVNTDFGSFEVICVPGKYGNGKLAIMMLRVENEQVEDPFTILTVNLDEPFSQTEKSAFLDTNNNPWAEKFVKQNKIAKDEYQTGISGFCRYPLYTFDLEKLFAK